MTRTLAALSASLSLLFVLPLPTAAQQNPYILEGLVVTASPTARPLSAVATHVTVLDGAKLRAEGLTRVAQALKQVPGLDVVQGGSTGATTSLFLRGGESDYVLVLVDGVQVNQPGGAFDFSSLTLDDVKRIEIVRGPASALYGSDAVSGVIQIITKDGQGPADVEVSARAGSYGRRRWSVSGSGGGERVSGSFGLSRLTTNGTLPFNNAYRNTAFSGTARFRPDGATTARVALQLGSHTYHFPTDGSGRLVDHNQYTYGHDLVASADVTRFVGGGVELQGQLGLTRTRGGTDDPPDGPADTLGYFASTSLDHIRRTSANLRAIYRFSGLTATLGWELEQERQRSATSSSSQWGDSSGKSSYQRWDRAYYAYLSGQRGAAAFNVGARLEDNERFGSLGTWQVGLTWRPLGAVGPRLSASMGVGIKEPTFYENYATGFAKGNPNLSPERSRSWEVGVDESLAGGAFTVRASYFAQRFQDLIQYTATAPSPNAPNFFNVAAASASGLETEAAAHRGPVALRASWTWLRTRVLDAGLDQGPGAEFVKGERLLRRPTEMATLGARYAAGARVSLTTELKLVGNRAGRDFRTYPARRVVLPRYETLSLGADVELWAPEGDRPGVSLTVRGENLLNESYEEIVGFPAPGRALFVGGRVAFGSLGG